MSKKREMPKTTMTFRIEQDNKLFINKLALLNATTPSRVVEGVIESYRKWYEESGING